MAISVSVCDDDPSQIKYLCGLLNDWAADKPFGLSVSAYDSAEAFLFDYSDHPCELLLLDIEMKRLNGMELAKRLRAEGDLLPIVFITGFSEYLAEGYEVEALHYLLKPVDRSKLYAVLDRYLKRHSGKSAGVLLTGEGQTRHVPPEGIVFLEARGHRTELHLNDGAVFESDKSIGEWRRLLCTASAESKAKNGRLADFLPTHRSYLVNLRYVRSIGKTECVLDSGESVPLSRRLWREVNERFIRFYS